MTLTDKFTVNGNKLYAPPAGNVKIEHNNIVSSDSGRTESGKMHIRWVRRDVVKVSFTYNKLTGKELKYTVDLMQGKEFKFGYYDKGKMNVIDAYCGQCSYAEQNIKGNIIDNQLYSDLSINVEEM